MCAHLPDQRANLNVAAYLFGYVLRFWNMGRLGKSRDRQANLRYFAEEQMVATPMLLVALGLVAVLGRGEAATELAAGFTSFWAAPELGFALAIGALYGLLCVFGTLIYLDHKTGRTDLTAALLADLDVIDRVVVRGSADKLEDLRRPGPRRSGLPGFSLN